MAIKNAYSEKDPEDTFRDVAEALWSLGADAVSRHRGDEKLARISFELEVGERRLPFYVGISVEGMQRALEESDGSHSTSKVQARRTAWKNVHDYVLAMTALVKMEQFEPEEVLAVFLYDRSSGRTLSEAIREEPDHFAPALPEPNG